MRIFSGFIGNELLLARPLPIELVFIPKADLFGKGLFYIKMVMLAIKTARKYILFRRIIRNMGRKQQWM